MSRLTPSASFTGETVKLGAEQPAVKNEEGRIYCA